jgi:divalent metal cation (Fe/Co/Zn/Cd) transporter
VALVYVTGWLRLDALVALAVGLNIVVTGIHLLRESTSGLMDKSLSSDDHEIIVDILKKHTQDNVKFHALQTRESGRFRYVYMHVLVPGTWTIQQGHDLLETVECEIKEALSDTTVYTHIEPLEDPRSWADEPVGRIEFS